MADKSETISSPCGRAAVHLHTSVEMPEVGDGTAKLLIGASVYLGKDAEWADYKHLYNQVYVGGGQRVLRPDGYFLVILTDAYRDGRVVPRNGFLLRDMMRAGYELLDTKVWKRRAADFFQPPFSLVWLFVPPGGTARRPKGRDYLQGVWDFPQAAGGPLAAYPDGLCRLIVESLTEPGDLIVDPFAGTARLLGLAACAGRRAVGYEINAELTPTIKNNLCQNLLF